MSGLAASSTSCTPRRAASARTRPRASSTSAGTACVITAAVLTTDGLGDPAIEVGGEPWAGPVDEVDDVLMVSLGAGQSRVYDAARLAPGLRECLHDRAHNSAPHSRVADDTLRSLRP